MSDHRGRYKNFGLDARELRRRREEDSVQLRKQKRDEVLRKRRTIETVYNDMDEDIVAEIVDESSMSENDKQFTVNKEMIDGLIQNDNQQILIDSAQKMRKILSKEPQPSNEVIQAGLIPRFVELLARDDCTILQFEVAWILTNICSGTSEQTRAVVNHGAIPGLIRLMNSDDMKVCEQAIWALGNIIGDGADLRDLVLQHNFLPPLLRLIESTDVDISFLRNETWVLVNLCRNKDPPPSISVVQQIIPALNYLIQSTDRPILIDASWAIDYITELGPDYSQLVIDSGLVEKMVPLLSDNEIKIQTAVIRSLGSIVTGDEDQTQAVIDAGALKHIRIILLENHHKIVKEALWFLSNVTAGSRNQIQSIIDEDLIDLIIQYLDKGDFSQQKEAAWAIYNYCLSGTSKQIRKLVDSKVIPPLCFLLKIEDMNLQRNILESLICILSIDDDKGCEAICEDIEECGGLYTIEHLQNSPNQEIYQFAYSIIEKFFSGDQLSDS